MAQVTLPYTLTPGTPENVSNLMSNLTALRDGVNTIDTAQLAADAVTAAKIKDGEVGTAELASSAVTTAKIADANVTFAKLDGATIAPLNTKAVFYVRDEKAANTQGGGFTSGAWRTRTLNTSATNTISGASLASNKVTLPSGTYYLEARAPAVAVARHQAIIYNVTDSSNALIGSSAYACPTGSSESMSDSIVKGLVTISASKDFELRHQCSSTKATDGWGVAANFGVVEVYSELIAWKVA